MARWLALDEKACWTLPHQAASGGVAVRSLKTITSAVAAGSVGVAALRDVLDDLLELRLGERVADHDHGPEEDAGGG
jgi:hypothetical protein